MSIKIANRSLSVLNRPQSNTVFNSDMVGTVEDIKTLNENDQDLQGQINSLVNVEIMHLTTAQRLALIPTNGMLVYDTDFADVFQYDNTQTTDKWRLFGAKGLLVQQDGLVDTNIPTGTTQIFIGNGAPTPSGGGSLIQISGAANSVAKFNASGIPVQGTIYDFGTFYGLSLQSSNIDGFLTVNGQFYFYFDGTSTTLRMKTPLGIMAVEMNLI